MENFALIALVGELRQTLVGMTVRRVAQYSGRILSLETRSGRMAGLKVSLDPRNPMIWVPGSQQPAETLTDDFVMVLRKHLASARLIDIEKPLQERTVELKFRTTLPATSLGQVTLIAELIPNSPNLILIDRSRRVLATALAPPPRRQLSLYEEYTCPESLKIPLSAVLGEDASWFDQSAFAGDPAGWLVRHIAGMGPILAAEIAYRVEGWAKDSVSVPEGIRQLVLRLSSPISTAWMYTSSPPGLVVDRGDSEGLRNAIVSPVELGSLECTRSSQTFPGMLAATRTVATALESANRLEKARSRELRGLRRENRKLELKRQRLLDRQRHFTEAAGLQETARLLAASGADMDRHHESVSVTEYSSEGSQVRSIPLDPTRTLRENISRMFRQQQKAGRGLRLISQQLDQLSADAEGLRARERRLRAITNWDAWLAATGGGRAEKKPSRPKSATPPARRRRAIRIDGNEVLVGRSSRENDELTFRVASGHDFWFHVADYSGSHVIVRNPTGADALDEASIVRAAQLAAFYSQARNATRVDVHYTQRKFVTKPRKARPGLVRLREYRTIAVEPRDWTRDPEARRDEKEPASIPSDDISAVR